MLCSQVPDLFWQLVVFPFVLVKSMNRAKLASYTSHSKWFCAGPPCLPLPVGKTRTFEVLSSLAVSVVFFEYEIISTRASVISG